MLLHGDVCGAYSRAAAPGRSNYTKYRNYRALARHTLGDRTPPHLFYSAIAAQSAVVQRVPPQLTNINFRLIIYHFHRSEYAARDITGSL